MYDDRGDFGFSGLFVCTPSNHNLKRYLNLINHTSMVDGDLLGQEWTEFKTNIKYRISFNHFINITWEDLDKAP
jgi:alpha-N-acetylglucosamine transferase